jgi:hypothetical protein
MTPNRRPSSYFEPLTPRPENASPLLFRSVQAIVLLIALTAADHFINDGQARRDIWLELKHFSRNAQELSVQLPRSK